MVLRYNDFINEKMGYPDNIDFYVNEIYKYCIEEVNEYMKFTGKWYPYKNSFSIKFDESEKNKEFPVNKIDIDFIISVKKRNDHEFVTAGFYPYESDDIKENEVDINLNIELCIQKDMASIGLNKIKLELIKAIRHEMLHAYESYKKQVLKNKPDNIWMNDYHMMNKDFTLGSDTLVDFLYLLYFVQAGERNAHIAQVFKEHYKDVDDAINRLINFSYLKEYMKILSEIKDNGYTEDDLTHVVRKLVSDYNDFCEDQNIEPLPKMVRLENKGLLKWMKHFNRIFKDQGIKMKKKLGKRIVESISFRRKKDIKNELLKYGIRFAKINDDETIDVNGDVNLYSEDDVDRSKFDGYCKGFYKLVNFDLVKVDESIKNDYDVKCLLQRFKIYRYVINDDGTIDVNGSVDISDTGIDKIPFTFGKVTGNFYCDANNLTSLKGCPYEVGKGFFCAYNNLTSLEGSPSVVGDQFDCIGNKLTSLSGMPLEIGGNFYCQDNNIKELDSVSNIEGYIKCDKIDISKFDGSCKAIYDSDGRPMMLFEKYVSGYERSRIIKKLKTFHIIEDTFSDNYTINDDGTVDVDGDVYLLRKNITKLPFRFGKVTGNFGIDHNDLETLEGSPYYVGGKFSCNVNKLKNLIGSPGEVGGDFECSNNSLSSLEGMTPEIGGDFICYDNPDLTEFDSISNIEGNIYCNRSVRFSKFKGHTNSIEY
jgi:hypothetical protein